VAEDGPLSNSELYWTNGRQLTVVGNLLNSDEIKKSLMRRGLAKQKCL